MMCARAGFLLCIMSASTGCVSPAKHQSASTIPQDDGTQPVFLVHAYGYSSGDSPVGSAYESPDIIVELQDIDSRKCRQRLHARIEPALSPECMTKWNSLFTFRGHPILEQLLGRMGGGVESTPQARLSSMKMLGVDVKSGFVAISQTEEAGAPDCLWRTRYFVCDAHNQPCREVTGCTPDVPVSFALANTRGPTSAVYYRTTKGGTPRLACTLTNKGTVITPFDGVVSLASTFDKDRILLCRTNSAQDRIVLDLWDSSLSRRAWSTDLGSPESVNLEYVGIIPDTEGRFVGIELHDLDKSTQSRLCVVGLENGRIESTVQGWRSVDLTNEARFLTSNRDLRSQLTVLGLKME